MVTTLYGLPLYCVSGYILHHAAAKIKRFINLRHGVPAAPRLPASLLLLRWRSQRPPLVHGDRLPTDGGIQGEVSPLACPLAVAGGLGLQGPRRGCAGGRLRPYIHPRKIRRRRADSDRGEARKRSAPVAVVRGHPEGKRRREPTRSKGPGICREAGPGVNGRGADSPPLSRSVLPAVPATQTVKPAACQDPLCP